MQMTHKHDVYFSPHSIEAHNFVMQIADYCNKRGIWYKISESTLGIGIVYGGNVAYVIDADRKTENSSEKPNNLSEFPTGSADTQTYITEDRDTRILDAWQVKQMQGGKE
jgi:hypothetical protein